jgi:hypothetical protein
MSDKRAEEREQLSELGRALQAARRRVEGVCAVCDRPFTGTTKRIYCSHNCAAKASRQALKQSQASEAPQV